MKRPPDAGLLVVFEGIDGAGKSTQARWLAGRLGEVGVPQVFSREPTDGPHGRRLRDSATCGRLPAAEELALFMADRRDHVTRLILPSLQAGRVVVLDRYYFSTAAYQGARGMDWRGILRQNETFAPEPDLLFWFDLPAESSQQRIGSRGEVANDFERLDGLRAVAGIYAEITRGLPYVHRLDARKGIDELRDEIWQVISPRLRWVAG